MTSPIPTEHEEQKKFFEWWAWNAFRFPGVILFAIPNGGHRHKAVAAKLKAEGVVAGVPDMVCFKPGATLWIEMKRKKGGRVSPAQKTMIEGLEAIGHRVEVCRGCQEAIDATMNFLKEEQR